METNNKEILDKVVNSKSAKESMLSIKQIFEGIDAEQLDEFIEIKPVLAALSLPENEFALTQEIILSEMNKQLNNVTDKILLVQALNATGMKAEDLVGVFQELMTGIQKEFQGKLSQQKIDFLKRFMGLMVQSISETEGIAKRIVPLPFEKCHSEAKIPTYARLGDAGMDIYATEDIEILPGETIIVPTGLKSAIPLGYELQVRPRSGLALKTPLRIANSPGTIDANYRDELGVIIWNSEPKIKDFEVEYDEKGRTILRSILYGQSYTITAGMRFAQLVLKELATAAPYEVSNVKDIGEDRGSGFGGTGLF